MVFPIQIIPKWAWTILFINAAVACAAQNAPEVPPAVPSIPAPLPESLMQVSDLGAAFEFRLDLSRPQPRGDIALLPSRAPVELHAEVKQSGALPEFYRVVNRTFRWSSSVGKIHAADPDASPGAAVYIPPETSELATVTAEIEIMLERPGVGETEKISVIKKADLQLLTPVESSRMQNGVLDGYTIGHYPDAAHVKENQQFKLHPDRYQIPEFFYKITSELKDKKVAPDVELGFFTIDFAWYSLGMPQYVAIDLNLVQKLQDLIELMRADGHKVTKFVPIYGFRPPAFNLGKREAEAATTLKVEFSMHQYGRAADFIIDENGDGLLDDLNGDGLLDVNDAVVIMHYINILDRKYRTEKRMEMVGGAGLYTHNDFLERATALGQTPYVHMDTRGFLEPDGTLVRWPAKWESGPKKGEYISWSKI